MSNIFIDGMTEQQLELQGIMEDQLEFTARMIDSLREGHQHYTDDCGDYLFAALDLSQKMVNWRMEGITEFEREMLEWQAEGKAFKDPEDDWNGGEGYLLENFASDGVSPAVYKFFGVAE